MALAARVPGTSLFGRPISAESDVAHPVLRKLYGYWASRRGARRCPARADLDPVDIPRLLPHLVLVDVQLESDSFQIRLAGTEVVRWSGDEITGKQLRDIHSSEIAAITQEYRKTARDLLPRLSGGPLENTFGSHRNVQRLLLPLSDDGVSVTKILSGVIFDRSLINASDEIYFSRAGAALNAVH